MPHFSECCSVDEYVCQVCGGIFCSSCNPSVWRTDITGNDSAGNVCPMCMMRKELERKVGPTSILNEPKNKIEKDIETKLKRKLGTDIAWASKALVRLLKFQTRDEISSEETLYTNSVGFSSADGQILTGIANFYLQRKYLSDKQKAIVLKKIPKYWKQVYNISDKQKLVSML